MKTPTARQHVIQACIHDIETRIGTINAEYALYRESAAGETKSTAGDKHDTAKAMMQLEQEKLGRQLEVCLQQKKILEQVDAGKVFKQVEFSSIVETDSGNFFISISSREIEVDGHRYIPISIQSPLAKAMLGKTVEGEFTFNNRKYGIVSIY